MEVLGLAPPSRPPPPPANPVQATRPAPPPAGPSNAPPRVSGHAYQTAMSFRLISLGTTTTKKEEGPVHPAKAEEALMLILHYVFPLSSIPFYNFALHRRLRDRRWLEDLP